MHTTLNLDDQAPKEAMEAQRQRIAEIREFRGQFQWEGSLDLLRKRGVGS